MHIAKHMVFDKLRDANDAPKIHLIPRAKAIVNRWLTEGHLICKGGTMEAQFLYRQLADEVCDLILGAMTDMTRGEPIHRAVLDPYTPEGSTLDVNFNTSKAERWWPRPDRSHINWVVLDSDWEAMLADAIESHPRVHSYAKNHNLGFEVPYLREGEPHRYRPDFLVRLEAAEPTTLVLEVKGFRGHDAMLKAETMRTRWIPAVNRLGTFGRWGFAELREVHDFGPALDAAIRTLLEEYEHV
jgi:type III restriction enzyme